jgi:hypothetical protein
VLFRHGGYRHITGHKTIAAAAIKAIIAKTTISHSSRVWLNRCASIGGFGFGGLDTSIIVCLYGWG